MFRDVKGVNIHNFVIFEEGTGKDKSLFSLPKRKKIDFRKIVIFAAASRLNSTELLILVFCIL